MKTGVDVSTASRCRASGSASQVDNPINPASFFSVRFRAQGRVDRNSPALGEAGNHDTPGFDASLFLAGDERLERCGALVDSDGVGRPSAVE
jgi:hypothetical protein